MDTTIIVALISGLCVGIPSVLATIASHNKSNALLTYRIDELDKKVEKHNNVVERMALQEQTSKSLEKRLEKLENLERLGE